MLKTYYLSLGSNINPKPAIESALSHLSEKVRVVACAPLYENAPLLPSNAKADWYQFFINTVTVIETQMNPEELLQFTKSIEQKLGRDLKAPSWSPRALDIDIIYSPETPNYKSESLTLPHLQWNKRNFVVTPLAHLKPDLVIGGVSVLKQKRKLPPLVELMKILNWTPDSFSKDGLYTKSRDLQQDKINDRLEEIFELAPAYLDIGAESTRPGASPLTAEQEWQRLLPLLEIIKSKANAFTRLSLDSYHPENILKSKGYGITVLNDVNGLKDPHMQEYAKDFEQVIAMHSLSVPADKSLVLEETVDVIKELSQWCEKQLEETSGLGLQQLVLDPGVGFGKTPLQSLEILQEFRKFNTFECRFLVGHSRKSFLNVFTKKDFKDRDPETLATSLELAKSSVDILRIHNLKLHQEAFRALSSLETPLPKSQGASS